MSVFDDIRDTIDRQHAAGEIDDHNRNVAYAMLRFYERRNAVPSVADDAVDLFGYGDVRPIAYAVAEKDVWIAVVDLAEPAGITEADAYAYWDEEAAEGDDADEILFPGRNGSLKSIRVLNYLAVMRLFLTQSPWSNEVMRALMPACRRAAVETGLGDQITAHAVDLGEDGHLQLTGETATLTEVILADGSLPSVEVIREHARRGPAGALHTST